VPHTPIPHKTVSKPKQSYENTDLCKPKTKAVELPKPSTPIEPDIPEDEYIYGPETDDNGDDVYEELNEEFLPSVIEPHISSRGGSDGARSNESSVESTHRVWLDDLSVSGVGEILKKLKLGNYVHKFADDMVSGSIVGEFDEDLLKEEYNLRKIEVIRLMKFIRTGHIPM